MVQVAVQSTESSDPSRPNIVCSAAVRDRIGLFSDNGREIPGRDDLQLDARESRTGQFLTKERRRFEAIELTKQNRDRCRMKKKVLLQLKDDFSQEGNRFLYENRLKECTCTTRNWTFGSCF